MPTTWFQVVRPAWEHVTHADRALRVWPSISWQGVGLSERGVLVEAEVGPLTVPVSVHPTREAAEAAARHLELAARDGRSPLWFGLDIRHATTLTVAELAVRLTGVGVHPPRPASPGEADGDVLARWQAWWDEQSPTWTPEQLAAAWELFDKVRFYEVVEIPLED